MQSKKDFCAQSEGRIALLEARLAEIQASREELRRELVRRACEPAARRSVVPARLALFFSFCALGMAAWGVGALLAPKPSEERIMEKVGVNRLPLVKEQVNDETLAVNADGLGAEQEIGTTAEPERPIIGSKDKVPAVRGGEGKRGGRPTRPPKKNKKPSIIDTFSQCGNDPLCGGVD